MQSVVTEIHVLAHTHTSDYPMVRHCQGRSTGDDKLSSETNGREQSIQFD